MGMYSEVIHPETGEILQVKFGDDNLKRYAVGDWVPRIIDARSCPMQGGFLDGAYEGEAGRYPDTRHYGVVIKDSRIVAVVPRQQTEDGIQPFLEDIEKSFEIPPPDPAWWPTYCWQKLGESRRWRQMEIDDWKRKHGDKEMDGFNWYTRKLMRQDGFFRRILPGYKDERPEPQQLASHHVLIVKQPQRADYRWGDTVKTLHWDNYRDFYHHRVVKIEPTEDPTEVLVTFEPDNEGVQAE